jgi:hypothetical protein
LTFTKTPEKKVETNTRQQRYQNRKYFRPRYSDLYTYKSPEPVITTYQTNSLNEKVYLLPMKNFKQFADKLERLKRQKQLMITYDIYRKQKEWTSDIPPRIKMKRKSFDWYKMNMKQKEYWIKIAQEKTNQLIMENTPRPIYYLEYDYHSPQSNILFEEISNPSYDSRYSGCIKEGARKIILEDYHNCMDYKNEKVKIRYFKDWWFRSVMPIELKNILDATINLNPFPDYYEEIEWEYIKTKNEMLPSLKENNSLYHKMKYWKTQETLNIYTSFNRICKKT